MRPEVVDAARVQEHSPAVLAERVATVVGDETAIRGGGLPMWGRLDARRRRPRTWLSGLTLFAAWGVTLFLLTVAALRVVCHDATVPLVWLNAFTLYVYLPAYVVLAIAAWKRRWLLAAANGAVVACHLAWVAPDFRPPTPFEPPPATSAAPSLRIFYANVRMGNLDPDGLLREAVSVDPDVIVLAEVHRWWIQEMSKSPLIAQYRFGTNFDKRHPGDVVVFSRLPVSRQQLITTDYRVSNVVDIPLGRETLRLFCLHAPRPLLEPHTHDVAFWQKIEPIFAEQLEPLVVIGDFNATQHSLVYERLTSGRLRSAHEDRGRGYATTWPNGHNLLPPIRIDHALLSPQVECVSIAEGDGIGLRPQVVDPGRPGASDWSAVGTGDCGTVAWRRDGPSGWSRNACRPTLGRGSLAGGIRRL